MGEKLSMITMLSLSELLFLKNDLQKNKLELERTPGKNQKKIHAIEAQISACDQEIQRRMHPGN